MLSWENPAGDPAWREPEREFARVWQALPKLVFSRTLETVEGNARLARGGLAEEVVRLKAEPGGDIAVGGAGLAAARASSRGSSTSSACSSAPSCSAGGTPFFPALDRRVDLGLIETRTFGSRVVHSRYRRV